MDSAFTTVDMQRARKELPRICDQVARGHGRVEIASRGKAERCIIISKEELDAMERALDILANTEEVRALHGQLARLATSAVSVAE